MGKDFRLSLCSSHPYLVNERLQVVPGVHFLCRMDSFQHVHWYLFPEELLTDLAFSGGQWRQEQTVQALWDQSELQE